MGYRVERVEKIIEKELSMILLQEAKNQLLKFVSITKVALTQDMSVATIWFTVLGEEDEKEATIKALEDAKGFLRSNLSKKLDLRKAPELRFKYDESLENGSRIERILSEINKK